MPNDLKLWDALFSNSNGLISMYTSLYNITCTATEVILKFTDVCLMGCPNKRVAYLALHGKKKKTRKKNWNRAMKIMTGK